jgi:hypothetical protein
MDVLIERVGKFALGINTLELTRQPKVPAPVWVTLGRVGASSIFVFLQEKEKSKSKKDMNSP